MAPDERGRNEEEARRILRRVEREADTSRLPGSLLPEEDDWAERWGRRIGALLGPALLALAALWLIWQFSADQRPA